MIRTQVSLTDRECEAAKRESKPWMRYAGMVESGDRKSSRRIDDVVYGQKG